jgi:hypothetical protein
MSSYAVELEVIGGSRRGDGERQGSRRSGLGSHRRGKWSGELTTFVAPSLSHYLGSPVDEVSLIPQIDRWAMDALVEVLRSCCSNVKHNVIGAGALRSCLKLSSSGES